MLGDHSGVGPIQKKIVKHCGFRGRQEHDDAYEWIQLERKDGEMRTFRRESNEDLA